MNNGEKEENRMTVLRALWEWWKRIGRKIGDFQSRMLLTLFYFVVLGPFALVVRWGSDPLALKAGTPRCWRPRANEKYTPMDQATRQF